VIKKINFFSVGINKNSKFFQFVLDAMPIGPNFDLPVDENDGELSESNEQNTLIGNYFYYLF
jgi:hypothetical protein